MTDMTSLPLSCSVKVNGLKTTGVDVGRCSKATCAMGSGVKLCCVAISIDTLPVTCADFSYELSKVTACGCEACADYPREVAVIGKFTADSDAQLELEVEHIEMDRKYEFIYPDQFYFFAKPQSGQIVFTVTPTNTYMPQLVTIQVGDGVSAVYTEVQLVRRPAPVTVDPAVANTIPRTSDPQSSMPSITISENAFIDSQGNVVSEDVDVYWTFSGPHSPAKEFVPNIDLPGSLTYEDEKGNVQLLRTFGSGTILAEITSSGETVNIAGNVEVVVNMPTNDAENTGVWLFNNEGSRLVQTSLLVPHSQQFYKADLSFANQFQYVNFVLPIERDSLCQVSVYVYSDEQFTERLPGATVFVYTAENGVIMSYISAVTNNDGKACVVIPCGNEHGMTLKAKYLEILLSDDHNLPNGISFKNVGEVIKFASPNANEIITDDGPFHKLEPGVGCENAVSPDYSFQLAVTDSLVINNGVLNVAESRPGLDNSWYRASDDYEEKETCMVLIGIVVSNLHAINHSRSWGWSRRGLRGPLQ